MQTLAKKYPLSFVSTLVLTMLLCAGVMGVSIFFLQKQASQALVNEASQKMLMEKGQYISHRVEMYLNEPILAGEFVSHMANFQDSLVTPVMERELKHLLEKDFVGGDAISRVGVSSAQGQYLAFQRMSRTGHVFLIKTAEDNKTQLNVYQDASASSPIVKTIKNYNIFARAWFIQSMVQTTPFWSASYYHRSMKDKPVMSWLQPYYSRDRKFEGVIFADIYPAMLNKSLEKLLPDSQSTLLLLDDKHRIVASSRAKYLNTQHGHSIDDSVTLKNSDAYPELKSFMAVAQEQSHGPQKVSLGGQDYYVLTHSIADKANRIKWSLLMISPDTSASMMLLHSHRYEIIILSMLVVAIFFALLMLIRQFFRHFNDLVQKTHFLGQRPWVTAGPQRVYPEIAHLDQQLHKASGFIAGLRHEHQERINHDRDTGLLTRTGLFNSLTSQADRNLMMMIRLTNFRDMRSTLGHDYSQKFVAYFSLKITELTPANTLLCRYSEDLFVVILPGINEEKDLDAYWGALSSLFNDSLKRDEDEAAEDGTYIYTGLAGAVLENLTAENLSECLMNAAVALQQNNKGASRECTLFTPQMREIELSNVQLHQALLDDLRHDGFHLVMQPIVNLDDPQSFNEGECLIRWHSSLLGFVPPDKFIDLAERTGHIVTLGRWIIEEACRELREFIARGAPEHFKLHINISAVQLQQSDFADHLLGSIQSNGLMNRNICLEITESVLLQDSQQVIERLNYLRRLGLSVAIDDFGSGYSSLSYLHLLPFDCLKIDRGFVNGVLDDKKSEAVISSVIMLSQQFGVPLVAEGLETLEMGDKLREMGCQKAQGYYYARPQSFSVWLPVNGVVRLNNQ